MFGEFLESNLSFLFISFFRCGVITQQPVSQLLSKADRELYQL